MTYLKKTGWIADKTETYSTFAGKNSDLFGIVDAIGISPDGMVLAQGIGPGQRKAHHEKLEESGLLPSLKAHHDRDGRLKFIMYQWSKKNVGKVVRYKLRTHELYFTKDGEPKYKSENVD